MDAVETLRDLNGLDRAAFVARLGGVFEHSPWVAERAYAARPFRAAEDLHAAMRRAVEDATTDEQLALLRAHPDLAGKLARAGTMTESSVGEQASAGLDRLSDAEYARFDRLNAAYREKFGFPFIIAVREHDKAAILAAFERRLGNGADEERGAALDQIFKITRLRLQVMFAD